MNQEEVLFARVIRYLLAHTFIIGYKNRVLYDFCRNNMNKKKINNYLEKMGYYIEVNEDFESVQMLNTSDADNEIEVGKNENLYIFSKLEQFVLALCWQYYYEHKYEEEVVLSAKELRAKFLSSYDAKYKKDISEPLRTLKYFNLINYRETNSDDFAITIYPTILCVFDDSKLKNIMMKDAEEENMEDEEE